MAKEDFDPYRAEITDCFCELCREVSYALSSVIDSGTPGRPRHREAVAALLAALRAGEHQRVGMKEYAQAAREAKAIRLAEARENGASAEMISVIERGYATVKMSDFYATGMGLGVGPRNKD